MEPVKIGVIGCGVIGTSNIKAAQASDLCEVVAAADLRSGKKGFGASGEINGGMTEKAAAAYNPSTSDQTIQGSQYLAGAQTIRAVTVENLQAQYIAQGVTVKVGCSADDDCVASVTGMLSSVVVSQDSTTKVLSIA